MYKCNDCGSTFDSQSEMDKCYKCGGSVTLVEKVERLDQKTCRACKKEIDKKASKCPYCQTKQGSFIHRHPLLAIFLVILVAWFAVTKTIIEKSSLNTITNTATVTRIPTPTESPEQKQARIDRISTATCASRSEQYKRYSNLDDNAEYLETGSTDITIKNVYNQAPSESSCQRFAAACLDIWGEQYCQNIAEQKIWIGMTEEQLVMSWGWPKDKNDSVGSWGVHTQWIFGDFGPYVYLEGSSEYDLQVTSWQE